MIADYSEDALLTARNKLVTLHLAILGLAEKVEGHDDEILSVECLLYAAMRDLDRGLKLHEPVAR
jgi:hypothetical protein